MHCIACREEQQGVQDASFWSFSCQLASTEGRVRGRAGYLSCTARGNKMRPECNVEAHKTYVDGAHRQRD